MGAGIIVGLNGLVKLFPGWGTSWHPEYSSVVQALVAGGEVVGGVALLAGFLTRSALGVLVIMIGAIFLQTGGQEFVIVRLEADSQAGWTLSMKGVEYEYLLNLALAVMSLSLMLLGSGRLGLDHLLWGHKAEPASVPTGTTSAAPLPREEGLAPG